MRNNLYKRRKIKNIKEEKVILLHKINNDSNAEAIEKYKEFLNEELPKNFVNIFSYIDGDHDIVCIYPNISDIKEKLYNYLPLNKIRKFKILDIFNDL